MGKSPFYGEQVNVEGVKVFLSLNEILEEIEEARHKLRLTFEVKGKVDPETIRLSQELDQVLTKYYILKYFDQIKENS